jgi:F1F0 ATPase subunit 2
MKTFDIVILGLGLFSGLVLGLIYFGGLWWTLERLPRRPRPKLWLANSYILRVAITLTGFFFIMRQSVVSLFFCLFGFFFMRWLLVRRFGPDQGDRTHAN